MKYAVKTATSQFVLSVGDSISLSKNNRTTPARIALILGRSQGDEPPLKQLPDGHVILVLQYQDGTLSELIYKAKADVPKVNIILPLFFVFTSNFLFIDDRSKRRLQENGTASSYGFHFAVYNNFL